MNPLWLIFIPFGVAPWVYLFRRNSTVAALLSLGTSGGVAAIAFFFPPDQTVEILGRSFLFDPERRYLLLFLYAMSILLFLYAWRISQGWSFFPFLLVILGLLSGVAMVDNFLLATLLLEMAGLLLLFLFQGGAEVDPRVSLGYLIPLILAAPCFLLSSWLFDLIALNPLDPTLIRVVTVLLGLGFGVILALFPFHLYLPPLARESPPMVTSFFLCLYQPVILALLWALLKGHLWLSTDSQALNLLLMGGLITSLGGGVLAFLESSPGPLLVYGAMVGLGSILVGLGTASEMGVSGAMAQVVNRSLAVLLVAVSWGIMRERYGGQKSDIPLGVARSLPWAALGYIIGGLALAGFPLTGGFAAQWQIYRALFGYQRVYSLGLLFGGVGVGWGYLRSLVPMWKEGVERLRRGEPFLTVVLILLLGASILLLGLYPGVVGEMIEQTVGGFPF